MRACVGGTDDCAVVAPQLGTQPVAGLVGTPGWRHERSLEIVREREINHRIERSLALQLSDLTYRAADKSPVRSGVNLHDAEQLPSGEAPDRALCVSCRLFEHTAIARVPQSLHP